MKKAVITLAITALLSMVAPVGASAAQNAPNHRLRAGLSLNWSGYAIEYPTLDNSQTQSQIVTDAAGNWSVPAVTCPANGHYYSSTWVGIDGYFGSGTVEQIGTEQDCSNGNASYYAWYEMYPNPMVQITSLSVTPGEAISADVSYIGSNQFTLKLNGFSTTQTSTSAQRVSAEWVEEAPSNGSILPLADFGTMQFNNASTTVTVNGSSMTGSIHNSTNALSTPWANDAITMVDRVGRVLASPGSLSADGTSFTDTWHRSK